MTQHDIFIGDKIEAALRRMEEENDEYYPGELQNAYVDNEIHVDVDLHGNYLNVKILDEP